MLKNYTSVRVSQFIVMLFLVCPLFAQETAPRLILVLSIDQMRFDYLTRFERLYQGGIRTLLDRGAVFSEAKYRHAGTETGPGHSVILSGRHPSHSGIISNDWYDPLLKKMINVVDDPVSRAVGGKGRGSSPVNFIGFTLGDFLKLNSPQSKVVGVSLKDRSAILMTGRRADAAYWYSAEEGKFITSTFYSTSLPAWLLNWNQRRPADRFYGKKWDRLLADTSVYEKYAGPDKVEGEWDRKDTIFPHSIRGTPPEPLFYDDFRRTPFADELTLEVALLARKAHHLGEDTALDILAISFSATDVIGHTYGADSQEIMDQLLRLDRLLKGLFDEIEKSVGLEKTWVVLTADHGSLPLVENLQARGLDARRVSLRRLMERVQLALKQEFPGATGLIAALDPPHIYLDEEALSRNRLTRQQVEECIRKSLMESGSIEAVYTQAEILDPRSHPDPMLTLVRNSFFQPRSPHLIAVPRRYVYLSDAVGGTGHGTAHDYDRHVPIIFMAVKIKKGRFVAPCGPEDIAPTLAEMLRLQGYPKEDDARILTEMLK